jgi:formyl-CoA transferase
MADSGTGMQMALAITAAYAQKLRTGEGQQIEVSMQESMTMFMRTIGVNSWGQQPAKRRGTKGGAPTGLYPCAPGGPNDYVYMLISNTRMWDQLCVAIEREDLLHDERFQSGRSRIEHSAALEAEITAWTMQHTKFDAMRILCEGGVAASAVFDTMEVYNDPHLAARGFIKTLPHPTGDVTVMSSPIRMSKSTVPLKAAPLLGSSTAAVLEHELGLSEADVAALADEGVVATGRKAVSKGV